MSLAARLSGLRGSSRLAVEATIGLADIVESVHRSVTRRPARAGGEAGRTRGITGFVYRSVRRVAGWVGGGVDGALARLGVSLEAQEAATAVLSSPGREALVAALNGVVGDHLEATGNPLAIPMQFRRDGRTLDPALEKGDRIVLFVHGLCRSDVQWRRRGHDHGAHVAAELGLAPVYLHYNSGRSISINGRELAARLEELVLGWGAPVAELHIVAHSMGGLVMRSACDVAEAAGLGWRGRLRKIVFLGTPHHGAPLERAGSWLDRALGATSYTAAIARLGKARSAGITDLRQGRWMAHDEAERLAQGAERFVSPPLPRGVDCYAAAATLASAREAAAGSAGWRRARRAARTLLGDGLVPLASALGDHAEPARALSIPPSRRWVGYGMSHLDLLDRREVYEQIREWLTDTNPEARRDDGL